MIYNVDASRKLLGCIFQNPQILNVEKYNLTKADFEPMEWHMRLYQSCVYLAKHGAKSITAIDLYSTVDKHPQIKEIFDNNQTKDFVDVIIKLVNMDNLDYYYDEVRKNTILRAYQSRGFDVSKFENNLINFEIKELIDWYEGLQIEIKKEFYKDKRIIESKAGDGMLDVIEQLKQEPAFGASTPSEFLNTVCRGAIKGQLQVISCTSGAGKTTYGLSAIAKIGAKELWNYDTWEFEQNPCYQNCGCLFIQYELSVKDELEIRLLAAISGVPAYHILNGKYSDGEEDRVKYAIKVLEESNIYTVLMPSYTPDLLSEYIRDYALNKNVRYVVFDYISDSSEASTEIAKKRNVATRGDQVIRDFSAALKQIARENNLFILSFTQTNGMENQLEVLDARCISGGKAAQNALDSGIIMSPLRKNEEEIAKMAKESHSLQFVPNRILHCYKTRFGSLPQGIKLWGYLDLNTGRWIDLFATDKYNNPIDNMTATRLIYRR